MTDRLITIASFATPLEARLAKNRLEADGVRAALEAETTTGMAWHLTNAIGGVKLLVMEQDAERAVEILEEADDEDSDEEDADDDAAADDGGQKGLDEAEEPLTRREENADRAMRGAVIGLLFWPLQFYVFWVLLKVFVSDQRLRPDKRKRAIIAAAICIPFLLAWCVFMRAIATG